MPRTMIELDPVSRITIDAAGQPGQRVFYLQAEKDGQVYTVLVEKIQILTLSEGIDQFLEEIAGQDAGRPAPAKVYLEERMHIQMPVDPLFRAGDMGLAYSTEVDRVCLIVRAIVSGEVPEEDGDELRLWASREQMAALSAWAVDLADRGRPICPQCNEPMDPAGHLCPKKNGHKH